MAKIIFITNMEGHRTGMEAALAALKQERELKTIFTVRQLSMDERWTEGWDRELSNADFIFLTWMGTGLCCDFLRHAAALLQKKQRPYLFDIMDPGEDKLDNGLAAGDKTTIKAYLACGGLENYQQLCLWLAYTYAGEQCSFAKPVQAPWHGIYVQGQPGKTMKLAEYWSKHCCQEKPTIGLIFSREEWLWQHTGCEDAVIKALHGYGCNVIPVFTTTMADQEKGITGLAEGLQEFYLDGKPYIDVLLNPFVFGLTVTGFLKLAELQKLGVPILQLVNIYEDFAWWEKDLVGLSANEVAYAVAMPEFDGALHSVPVSTNERAADGTHYRKPLADRIDLLARKALKWARLKRKPNHEKKIAIVFHNYPPTNANIGSAASLDSISSVRFLLRALQEAGYKIDHLPKDSKEFIGEVTAHVTNDRRYISEQLLEHADGKLGRAQYQKFFEKLPGKNRNQMRHDWEEPPGTVFRYKDDVIVPGFLNGNIFITVQPPRGFGEDPGKIYHSPDCAPTHQYLGFYHWIRDVWGADAMMHIGTHGNLEWLPGKGNAMSASCYPDICTGDMPNIYPYWITCVGEGIQAKRRSAACLISYLTAPMSIAGSYEEMAELENLLEEYCHFKKDAEASVKIGAVQDLIRAKAKECNLDEDVPEAEAVDFDDYVGKLHVFVTDIKNMQISTGLHVLGEPPTGEDLQEFMLALTKLDNGKIPSLTKTLAALHGYDYYQLLEHSGQMLPDGSLTFGMLLEQIRAECIDVMQVLQPGGFKEQDLEKLWNLPWTQKLQGQLREQFIQVIRYICQHIAPSLLQTTLERENSLQALADGYVDPSPSGAPTSGGADLLPTGRNFYSIDPRSLPTEAAWAIGKQMADDVIKQFIAEEGHYPESVGIILWATSNMRNHGQCIAEFLYLMGMRPVWQKGTHRVVALKIIPLCELKRPRVDVTGRISGLFRDSLPASVTWMDDAVQQVAKLDEDVEMNYVRKHVLEEAGELQKDGLTATEAWRQASFRIFGDPPGAHGAGTGAVLEAKNWETIDDIAAVYTRWGAHAYGSGASGDYLPERFKKRMTQIDVTIQNVDHRESSMLAGDDYNNYRGGMVAAVRAYKGSMPKNYVSDSSDRSKVQLRSLDTELKRWFRGEAMNPKYIEGMKKHGYAGAGELSTYVAVSYQWDATIAVMEDWMYEKYAEKYALDEKMQRWLQEVNPWALQRITEVLLEAEQRGLWQARAETKAALQELFLQLEGELEGRSDAGQK